MDGLSYVYERPEQVEELIAAVEERTRDARAEADYAQEQPGLDGPAAQAEAEADRLEALASDWRGVAARVQRGYAYWEQRGFEEAVDACGEVWEWVPLSETLVDVTFAHRGTTLRLPLPIQGAYVMAFASGIFDGFDVCLTFEPSLDEATPTTNYLFGKARFPVLGSALFLVDQWTAE